MKKTIKILFVLIFLAIIVFCGIVAGAILKSDILKNMIKQTIFAVSLQESRPLLTGLNLKISNKIMDLLKEFGVYNQFKKRFLEKIIIDRLFSINGSKNNSLRRV